LRKNWRRMDAASAAERARELDEQRNAEAAAAAAAAAQKQKEKLAAEDALAAKRAKLIGQVVRSSEAWEALRARKQDVADGLCDNVHGVGCVVSAATDDQVCFLRRIARSRPKKWGTMLATRMRAALLELLREIQAMPAANASLSSSPSSSRAIAALGVMGGHVESFRVGGRVKVLGSTGASVGTILNSSQQRTHFHVLFDGAIDPDDTQSMNTLAIDSVTAPTPMMAEDNHGSRLHFALDAELSAVFHALLFKQKNKKVPLSAKAKELETSEQDAEQAPELTRVDSLGSEDSGIAAGGEGKPLSDSDVTAALYKQYAARAFMVSVRSPTSAQAAVRAGLLPRLLETTARPVRTLADTVSINYVESRWTMLRRYMFETRAGAMIPLDAKPPRVVEEKPLTEKEKARQAMAEQLMAMQVRRHVCLFFYPAHSAHRTTL
jgi:hypothetical protein